MKKLILVLVLAPLFSFAQTNLKGLVINNDQPVEFANVIVSTTSEDFISGAVTDSLGNFTLNVEPGSFILNISHLNYQSIDTLIDHETLDFSQIFKIQLFDATEDLEEIVVTAKKKTIVQKIDRTVIDIESNAMISSGNIFEALKSTPGLSSSNESIVMLGKGNARIAIDGKILELSGDELSEYLKSLPANEIKSIEIITNPPARYQAEGNSGIINLVTKRLKENVWRDNLSISYNQGKLAWQTMNNSFRYKKNNLSLVMNFTGRTGSQEIVQFIEPSYTNNPQKTVSVQNRQVTNFTPRLIVDYNLSNRTTLGVQFQNYISRIRQFDDLNTAIYNSNDEIHAHLRAEDTEHFVDHRNTASNFYFTHQLDTLGKKLTMNLDMLDYQRNTKTALSSERLDRDFNFVATDFTNRGDSKSKIKNYSARIDVDYPLEFVNLSYGAALSQSITDYEMNNFEISNLGLVLRPEASNDFNFEENIQAAYLNANKVLGKKLEGQIGLRAERTKTIGRAAENAEGNTIHSVNYFKIFPTFYLQYRHNDNHNLALNYGKRINRPNYHQLNPARSFISGQSSQQGNPFLKPSYTHNFELTHTFKSDLYTTLACRQTKDGYSFLFDLNDETEQQNITYKNVFNEQTFSVMTSYEFRPTSWWSAQSLLFFGYSKAQLSNEENSIALKNSGRTFASLNNQIQISQEKKLSGQINVWYDSPYSNNIYSFEKSYAMDVSISVADLVDGLTITVGAYDIFNSSPRLVTSTINGVDHSFKSYPSNRYLRLYLSYGFGNKKLNTQTRQFGNEVIHGRSN